MVFDQSRTSRRGVAARLRPVVAIGALATLEVLAMGAARTAWSVVRAPGPASLDEAVVLVVLAACVLLGGWLVATTTIACAAHLPGRLGAAARRWSRALAPAATRRVAAVLVGAALGTSLAPGTAGASGAGAPADRSPGFAVTLPSPAASTPAPAAPSTAAPSTAARSIFTAAHPTPPIPPAAHPSPAPGWTPSRPAPPPALAAGLLTGAGAPHSTEVAVHRGDSLWGIARRHLGPGATDAEVAAAWPHWYAANRDVIGPDPDVLLPGQLLRVPARTRSGSHVAGAHR